MTLASLMIMVVVTDASSVLGPTLRSVTKMVTVSWPRVMSLLVDYNQDTCLSSSTCIVAVTWYNEIYSPCKVD